MEEFVWSGRDLIEFVVTEVGDAGEGGLQHKMVCPQVSDLDGLAEGFNALLS